MWGGGGRGINGETEKKGRKRERGRVTGFEREREIKEKGEREVQKVCKRKKRRKSV